MLHRTDEDQVVQIVVSHLDLQFGSGSWISSPRNYKSVFMLQNNKSNPVFIRTAESSNKESLKSQQTLPNGIDETAGHLLEAKKHR